MSSLSFLSVIIESMKVSVVIPAYNEEKYIGACLDCFMKQEVPADEVIVINNNSTDQTEVIAKKYPVRILDLKEQGVIRARNVGYDKAKYDIIARTDADTLVPENWIKRIKEDFGSMDIDALTGPISYYDTPIKSPKFSQLFYSAAEQLFHYPMLIGPNMAITKKIWRKIRKDVCLDPHEVHEDIDIGIHIATVGGKIYTDRDLIVQSSGRRIVKKPQSFFIEYTQRLIKMNQTHGI